MNRFKTLIAMPAFALSLAGCNSAFVNDRPSLHRSHVQPVMTEHSLALACLGDLIDRSTKPALTVYVRPIADRTVPIRFEKRRLSLGGEWWLHTAINKIGSDRVTSVTSRKTARRSDNYIEISGAWTQDDFAVGSSNAELDFAREGSATDFDLFAGRRHSVDVIAGDFLSVRDRHVIHATAISLAVGAQRDGFGLRIQDATYDLALDLSASINEGPQFAQRRIAEAAALVHVSRAFDIDYRPCIEMSWASSADYQQRLRDYLAQPERERNRALQQALRSAGYRPGPADGVWGQRSARALMRFQSDRGLPITGRPSAEVFMMLTTTGDTAA
jgi:hypothetical protein